MSWSVSASGSPAVVKEALKAQFASARNSTQHVQHERDSVAFAEKIVNDQIDFLAQCSNIGAVEVTAHGSAYRSSSGDGDSGVFIQVRSAAAKE